MPEPVTLTSPDRDSGAVDTHSPGACAEMTPGCKEARLVVARSDPVPAIALGQLL